MQSSIKASGRVEPFGLKGHFRRNTARFCALACLAALATAAGFGRLRSQSQASFQLPAIDLPKPSKPQTADPPQQKKPEAASETPDQQKRAIANQCADLLKMATDLKAAVDKSSKDTLSVTVVKKAGEIEQMARGARLGLGKS
jgi:hypothetical protein